MSRLEEAPVAYIREKLFIRYDIANTVDYREIYERSFFKEKDCAKCSYLDERPSDICYGCRSFLGTTILHEDKLINGIPYVGVPWGDQKTTEKLFNFCYDDEDVVDQRATPKMPHKLKWVKPLYTGREIIDGAPTADQEALVQDWGSAKGGIIRASPRTGKSVVAAYIGTRLGLRVLITTHDTALCRQMADEYVKMTNVKKVARKLGVDVSELIYHIEDNKPIDRKRLKKACVVSVNYQKFIRDKRKPKVLRNLFGLLVVDEVHQASAKAFAEFINSINARYRLGLSATPDRRDGKHVIGRMLLGPVTAVSDTMALIPQLTIIETGIGLTTKAFDDPPKDGGAKIIETSKIRNERIVKEVLKDLERGHTGVIVPVGSRAHLTTLRTMFEKELGKSAVITYYGGCNKQKKIADFHEKGKVMVGMWQMMKQGLTLKKASSIHIVLPRSDGHFFYQLVNRVCTPAQKPSPIVRIYIDDVPVSRGCFRSVYWDEIIKHLQGRKVDVVRYRISPKDQALFMSFARSQDTVLKSKARRSESAGNSNGSMKWRF